MIFTVIDWNCQTLLAFCSCLIGLELSSIMNNCQEILCKPYINFFPKGSQLIETLSNLPCEECRVTQKNLSVQSLHTKNWVTIFSFFDLLFDDRNVASHRLERRKRISLVDKIFVRLKSTKHNSFKILFGGWQGNEVSSQPVKDRK